MTELNLTPKQEAALATLTPEERERWIAALEEMQGMTLVERIWESLPKGTGGLETPKDDSPKSRNPVKRFLSRLGTKLADLMDKPIPLMVAAALLLMLVTALIALSMKA